MKALEFQKGVVGGCLLLLFAGCGRWPPIVETKRDIAELSQLEKSIRARGLADDDLAQLTRFQDLATLDFSGGHAVKPAKITDAGLARLAELKLPKLDMLNLGYCTNITDAGLAHVGRMENITWLSLMACPQITDAGLKHLLPAQQLTSLDLRGCGGITDAGLAILASKTNWQSIMLGGCTNVSSNAVIRLQAALPQVAVEKDEWEWGFHK
jgi:hypothetical protein